ncbi:MAG: PadR family transcriptional regulator [Gemmatimonadota bacterium]
MADGSTPLLPGTLEMLVLQVLSVGPEHGWGIGQRLQQASRGRFEVNQGSLYPALQRLLKKGWLTSEWRVSESGRRARYYELTRSGERQLARERKDWAKQVEAVGWVFDWAHG